MTSGRSKAEWYRAAGLDTEVASGVSIEDVCADDVETRPVKWLWASRIPKRTITIFDGDPDLGKSVVTMDIAGRVSAGRKFPDGATCEAGNVLIANVEDGVADTIVPRLKAHGADLRRVFLFSGVPDGNAGTRLLDLPADIPLLEEKIADRKISLLIIDPVLTMLGGDANKDQDARRALTPLRDMAERTGAAVVCVRHLNKSVGLKAIQRGGGNMGLIGVARAGSFFAEHPEQDGLKVMAAHKSNLAEKPPSLSYRIVSSTLHNTARVEWTGVTDHDANSLAAGPATPAEKPKQGEAKEFLSDELATGPMWAKDVLRDARDAGIAQATLYLAKAALRVHSEKIGTEGWQWSLPTNEDDDSPTAHKDQDLYNLYNLQKPHSKQDENSAYVKEGNKGTKGGGGGESGYHLPETLLEGYNEPPAAPTRGAVRSAHQESNEKNDVTADAWEADDITSSVMVRSTAPPGAPPRSDEQNDPPSNRRLTQEEVDRIKQLRAQGVPGWKARDMVRADSEVRGDATGRTR